MFGKNWGGTVYDCIKKSLKKNPQRHSNTFKPLYHTFYKKGGEMDIKRLVSSVDGLNSVSTAKKWISLIKEISGHEFKKVQARNKKQFLSFYNFTDNDVENFKTIAYLKNQMSLKEAIKAVYGDLQKSKENTLADKIDKLEGYVLILYKDNKEYKSKIKFLTNKVNRLKKALEEMEATLELLPFALWEKARRKFGK